MVEAILRLAPEPFTRPEAAVEAGLHKPSANRVLTALERDGIIEVVGRRPIRYGVTNRIVLFEILSLTSSALRLERRSGPSSEKKREIANRLQARLEERAPRRSGGPAKGEGDPIMELRGLGRQLWKGVDPDDYVDELRRGRQNRSSPRNSGR
jgi:hypothetical protein